MLITGQPPTPATASQRLMTQARELETAFLAEMLGHAGLGKARDAFGGGIGEGQFASFLRDEQARAVMDRGGIGLAEALFKGLEARSIGGVRDAGK